MSAASAAYRGLVRTAAPALRAHLRRRARHGKEDPDRIGERMGVASAARPAGPLVWCHAASVGESLGCLPLIAALRERAPDIAVLLTTGTRTSAQILPNRLPGGVIHQYHPLDHPAWVGRFLAHWRPDVALFAESEIWPTLLGMAQARGAATGLVNARMSARSVGRWRRAPGLIRPLMNRLDVCLAQDAAQAARLADLGAPEPTPVGNLKYALAPAPPEPAALAALRAALGTRPRWLAASTHPGEEAAAAEVHAALAARHPGLVTLIAPRHPARGDAIAADLAARGLAVARRSRGEACTGATDVYLLDTLGELNLLYSLASVVFVGGSLAAHGGHNPIEPAHAGCAILHGPDMANARDAADALDSAGAARRVEDAPNLAAAVDGLLANPPAAGAMADQARAVAGRYAGVVDAVMAECWPLIAPLRPAAAA
jgi:3-deoxy-D-manno-octulosonic-acid transferase